MEVGSLAQWAAAGASTCAVVVALFGDWFRSILFQPQLRLMLENTKGVAASETKQTDAAGKIIPDIRYYHLVVKNESRLKSAKDVRVNLLRIEAENYVRTLDERVPLNLRHEAAFGPRREVGSPLEVDLLSINSGRGGKPELVFRVVRAPNTATISFKGPQRLRATVEADCAEGKMVCTIVEIKWDGVWSASDMASHLQVSIAQ